MNRIVLPALAISLVLMGCGSDTICPVGFYGVGSACIPIEVTDATDDPGESDLGDAGVVDDAITEDTTVEDTSAPDTPTEDVPQADAVPDVPEADVVLDVPEEDVCTPDCADFECGPDGCGGVCGSCGDDESCIDGSCDFDPIPPPSDCADGFDCVAACDLTDECIEACGISSANESLQDDIFSAVDCAVDSCGDDSSDFGWQGCAEESCSEVRSCLGISTAEGACTNSADTIVLAETGTDAITGVMGDCSIGCFSGGDPASCISECVEGDTGLSADCSACFGATGACTLSSCLFDCISPDSPGCASCVESSCGEAFSECAGLGFPG
ncbi:MAG: hypothetical protein ACJAYU_001005 [Bradymonadia bacterium]|jgi:hypothetical protein